MQQAIGFRLGRLYITPGAIEALYLNYTTGAEYLTRHLSGDWGDICDEDKESNNQALENGARILSAYRLKNGTRIWIITEAANEEGERIATTLLLPEEY